MLTFKVIFGFFPCLVVPSPRAGTRGLYMPILHDRNLSIRGAIVIRLGTKGQIYGRRNSKAMTDASLPINRRTLERVLHKDWSGLLYSVEFGLTLRNARSSDPFAKYYSQYVVFVIIAKSLTIPTVIPILHNCAPTPAKEPSPKDVPSATTRLYLRVRKPLRIHLVISLLTTVQTSALPPGTNHSSSSRFIPPIELLPLPATSSRVRAESGFGTSVAWSIAHKDWTMFSPTKGLYAAYQRPNSSTRSWQGLFEGRGRGVISSSIDHREGVIKVDVPAMNRIWREVTVVVDVGRRIVWIGEKGFLG
ncbi:hypothetical protein EDB83DRAFT_2312752 [Lactarius deliciosus]|nr:hypothetical protein EDB83DRAFT_2312752 [Lactarius deliciosus]